MLDGVGAHLHRRDRLVDPGGHDIRHTGRTAAGRGDGLLSTAGDGIGFRAPALISLFVIDGLLGIRSRCLRRPHILTIKKCQPIVDRDAAGGIQACRMLEGKHIGPRVIAILAVNGCAHQRLHRLDVGAAAVILVLYRRQGFCQSSQGLGSCDAVNGKSMLLLVLFGRSLLLDGKGITDGKTHQQTVGAHRLLAIALTLVLQDHRRSPPPICRSA